MELGGVSCNGVGHVGTEWDKIEPRSGMSEWGRVSRNGVNASLLEYGGGNGNDNCNIHLQRSIIICYEFQPI